MLRRRIRRARPGDGTPLPEFRWWHTLHRSLFSIDLMGPDASRSTYSVEVRQLGDKKDGRVRARLYRNNRLASVSTVPAEFLVPGGSIEVAVGTYGFKRCHFVSGDGASRALVPHPKSMEGRRARLHSTHRGWSRLVGAVSTLLVLIGVAVAVPQLAETLLHIPPVVEAIGRFDLPYTISDSTNIAVIVAAAGGSAERALRLKTSWLDDLAG